MSDLEVFRRETREWLEANCPPGVRNRPGEVVWGGRRCQFPNEDAKIWLERMVEKGWTVPTWPKPYGGAGLTDEEAKVLRQEMARIDANAPLFSFGIAMLAPALMAVSYTHLRAHET